MDSADNLEKRRLKFSDPIINQIIIDTGIDGSLISRGSQDFHLCVLQTDQTAREQLLSRIELLKDEYAIEHCLRKLREVIISIFDANKDDRKFIKLVQKVYHRSYQQFMRRNDFISSGNLILNFMYHHFPADPFFRQLYALYVSHVESNLSKCASILEYNGYCNRVAKQQRQLIRISSIYVANLESPSEWFFMLRNLLSTDQARFLISLPAFQHMKNRTFQYIKKCYNQISLDYVFHNWFYDVIDKSEIPDNWSLSTIGGKQTVIFKRRTSV